MRTRGRLQDRFQQDSMARADVDDAESGEVVGGDDGVSFPAASSVIDAWKVALDSGWAPLVLEELDPVDVLERVAALADGVE